ncbi:MAG: hypothetical protein PF518_15420 [Spirochaetaceae bacterium]|nr:hypothetical protein [Spirochaetaceae bacterium]
MGGELEFSCRVSDGNKGFPVFRWHSSTGEIIETDVSGEVNYFAPDKSGTDSILVEISINGKNETRTMDITILPVGALKKTADILITVDTTILENVWVNSTHKSESFKGPLSIKGTFRYDPESELAFAGGSWPTYPMYDDGTHGDVIADDEIWSILMKFEKTDSLVYFALDDTNTYRVEYESGLSWTIKMVIRQMMSKLMNICMIIFLQLKLKAGINILMVLLIMLMAVTEPESFMEEIWKESFRNLIT